MNSCWTIANCGARLLLTRLILSKKSEGAKLTQKSIISSAKITCPHSRNGIALRNWKKSSVLLFLIARGREQSMITRWCIEGSTSLPRRSERELPPANRFAISCRDRSKKLLAAKNFTRSKGNNRRTVSENLCGIRLEQKGGRDCRPGFAFDLDVYRFLCDLLSQIRAATQSDRK